MELLLFILFILNITYCFISAITVSDPIKPFEFCNNKEECEEIGIKGEVNCISSICSCVNNTKYKPHLRGCYKNAGLGEVCNVKSECITPGSICGNTKCGKDLDRCVCEGDTEFVYHSCEPIRDILDKKCCGDSDCKIKNMYCDQNTQKCKCKTDFYFFNNTCVSHTGLKICKNDDDCVFLEKSKCSKIENNPIGICECEMNYIYFKDRCVEYTDLKICENDDECDFLENSKCSKTQNITIGICECEKDYIYLKNKCVKYIPCTNSDQRGMNENCYLLSNSEGLTCKNKEILFNNKCLPIKEKFCQIREDCKDTEFCYQILEDTGICIQAVQYNKNNNEQIKTRSLKDPNYYKNRAENINIKIIYFLYLLKCCLVCNYLVK